MPHPSPAEHRCFFLRSRQRQRASGLFRRAGILSASRWLCRLETIACTLPVAARACLSLARPFFMRGEEPLAIREEIGRFGNILVMQQEIHPRFCLAEHGIPIIFISFPRLIEDGRFVCRQMRGTLPSALTPEAALAVRAKVANVAKVRERARPCRAAITWASAKRSTRFRRRWPRSVCH